MTRLAVPLLERKLWATGDVLLRAELQLALKDNAGQWLSETFLVDSGSEMTTMPAYRAKQLDLPVPQRAAPGAVHSQTGLAIRSGYVRVKVPGLGQAEYAFPCFFFGDPNQPPGPNAPGARGPRNLLGLSGVLNHLRISFDGDPTPSALYGNLIVEVP
jgi:hypothetical protein